MKRVLVVVAHPDDETIWMGGTLLKNKENWKTKVITLCRKDDAERAEKFYKICKILNVDGSMSDLEDDKLDNIGIDEIANRILSLSQTNEYDYIFTHGKNGEYGHKRHLDVHNTVISLIKSGKLKCKKLFLFSYIEKDEHCIANKNSDNFIRLDNSLLLKKKNLIQEVYGFQKNSFEERSCSEYESFNFKNLK